MWLMLPRGEKNDCAACSSLLQFDSLFLWLSPITETDLIHLQTDFHTVTFPLSCCLYFSKRLLWALFHGLISKGWEDLVYQIRETNKKQKTNRMTRGEDWRGVKPFSFSLLYFIYVEASDAPLHLSGSSQSSPVPRRETSHFMLNRTILSRILCRSLSPEDTEEEKNA